MPNDVPDDGKVQSVECKTQFQQYGKMKCECVCTCVCVYLYCECVSVYILGNNGLDYDLVTTPY